MLNDEQTAQAETPTDWSKFEGSILSPGAGQPGGLPAGMGSPHDDKLHVRFFMRPRIDQRASQEANRPIFKDVPFIEIMIPGDKNNIVTAEVWAQHIQRFPLHWAQFQAGIKEQVVGTPLKLAPFLTESQVEELGFFKIRTIEQLADMNDSSMSFMGAQELKQAAARFLARAHSGEALLARIEALEAENKRLSEAKPPEAKPAEEGPEMDSKTLDAFIAQQRSGRDIAMARAKAVHQSK